MLQLERQRTTQLTPRFRTVERQVINFCPVSGATTLTTTTVVYFKSEVMDKHVKTEDIIVLAL